MDEWKTTFVKKNSRNKNNMSGRQKKKRQDNILNLSNFFWKQERHFPIQHHMYKYCLTHYYILTEMSKCLLAVKSSFSPHNSQIYTRNKKRNLRIKPAQNQRAPALLALQKEDLSPQCITCIISPLARTALDRPGEQKPVRFSVGVGDS